MCEQDAGYFTGYFNHAPGAVLPEDMSEDQRLARYASTAGKPVRPSLRRSVSDGGAALMACHVPSTMAHETLRPET
jgi:hypothetical protein